MSATLFLKTGRHPVFDDLGRNRGVVSGIRASRRLHTESSTARFPKTKHSISELDANLLAPYDSRRSKFSAHVQVWDICTSREIRFHPPTV